MSKVIEQMVKASIEKELPKVIEQHFKAKDNEYARQVEFFIKDVINKKVMVSLKGQIDDGVYEYLKKLKTPAPKPIKGFWKKVRWFFSRRTDEIVGLY